MKHSEVVKLKHMLLSAEDDKLLRILQVVERHAGFVEVLGAVRPRLVKLRPPRPCTLERILVLPFEDLLVTGAQGQLQSAGLTVGRSALGRLIEVMTAGLNADAANDVRRACATVSLNDPDRIAELGSKVWPDAAKALACPPDGAFGSGDRHGLRPQMALASNALLLAPLTMGLRRRLPPKPFGDLTEAQAAAATDAIRAALKTQGAEGLKTLMFILVARARRVDEVMQLLAVGQSDAPADQRVNLTGAVASFCVERAVRASHDIVKRDAIDLGVTAAALEGLVNLVESIGMVGEGVHRADLDRAMTDVGRSVGAACDKSLREGALADGLEGVRKGTASPADWLEAEGEARKLAKMRIVGRSLGLEEVVAAAARAHVGRLGEALAARPRPKPGDRRAVAEYDREVVAGARLVEIMLGAGAAVRFVAEHRAPAAS